MLSLTCVIVSCSQTLPLVGYARLYVLSYLWIQLLCYQCGFIFIIKDPLPQHTDVYVNQKQEIEQNGLDFRETMNEMRLLSQLIGTGYLLCWAYVIGMT